MKTKLTGFDAIEAKEANYALVLNKYNDPTEPARENLGVDEAREIAKEDPGLIYTETDYKLTETTDARGNVWWTITSHRETILETRDEDEANKKATEFGILGVE